MHIPVLLDETLEFLAIRPESVILDTTAGLGGHAGAIARRLSTGMVIACDRDAESLELARQATAQVADRIRFVETEFSRLESALSRIGISSVSGLLADLGVSRNQLTDPERGFSLQADGPLDMRMSRSQELTAADLVNQMAEKALADLIFRLGEEGRSRKIAGAIIRARPIQSTLHLAKVIERAAPRMGRIHPATRTFMALRRAVNGEEEELEALLDAIPRLVAPGGRAVVITFMSLEDRKVKQSFQALARSGRAMLVNRHVVRPTEREVGQNPASRSAKLRALEMREPLGGDE